MSTVDRYLTARGSRLDASAELRRARELETLMKQQLIKDAISNGGRVMGHDGLEYEIKFSISSVREVK
jgi:hypothetical protein